LEIIDIKGHETTHRLLLVIRGAHRVDLTVLIDLTITVIVHAITGLIRRGERGARGTDGLSTLTAALTRANPQATAGHARGVKALISAPVTVAVDPVTEPIELKWICEPRLTALRAARADREGATEPKATAVREVFIGGAITVLVNPITAEVIEGLRL
jgi:hypothetical protein